MSNAQDIVYNSSAQFYSMFSIMRKVDVLILMTGLLNTGPRDNYPVSDDCRLQFSDRVNFVLHWPAFRSFMVRSISMTVFVQTWWRIKCNSSFHSCARFRDFILTPHRSQPVCGFRVTVTTNHTHTHTHGTHDACVIKFSCLCFSVLFQKVLVIKYLKRKGLCLPKI